MSATGEARLAGWRVACVAAALCGAQVCWSIQIGISTKTFLELGMPASLVSAAWLAGPLSGTVVQPIVGVLSDRCTARLGRRRPFMLAALGVTLFAMALFAAAAPLGAALAGEPIHACAVEFIPQINGSSTEGTRPVSSRCPMALSLAVTGFWLQDFAVNAFQGPTRTLMTDLIPPSQQATANAWFGFMAGLGNALGAALAAADIVAIFPFFGNNLRALYAVAGALVFCCVILASATAHEVPLTLAMRERDKLRRRARRGVPSRVGAGVLDPADDVAAVVQPERGFSLRTRMAEAWRAWQGASAPLRHAFYVQCFTWIAWFTTFIYATSWMGERVFGGSPSAPEGSAGRERYDEGVRRGNLALALQAIFALAATTPTPYTAAFLPWLMAATSTKAVYISSQAVMAVCLFGTLGVTVAADAVGATAAVQAGGMACLILLGWCWAVTMTIPWAIAGSVIDAMPDKGLLMAIMNVSQAAPEMVAALVGFVILSLPHGLNPWGSAMVMAAGGVSAVASIGVIVGLGVGDDVVVDDVTAVAVAGRGDDEHAESARSASAPLLGGG
ncbi:sucrose transporter 3 [Thecamonas trahens ATCC 50062]|uniref:Sucrose transporter 3 n=1 Tax=Thecamonas trahens ATCC 50062 TaxID=461836 RepID=A0A0L0D136_THETB|nr:sucrose transporter 3 [Thecamonas trahens ATCC 50062]KNC46064.1 sucrose transporter 3 [Thecamonas trahens ATCC 50062]|eukprot:XP_013763044.1 sucrose transporter 3 [Thecamonas trahens ATCC 50062]